MLKAYAIGFVGAVLAILVAAGIWFVARPTPEPGLLWGGTVYTSKQEFNGYLKSKGLSYQTWAARNPGAAPWEPAAAQALPVDQGGRGWTAHLPLVGLVLAAGVGALLLVRRVRSPAAVLARRRRRASARQERTERARDRVFVPTVVPWIETVTPPPSPPEPVPRTDERPAHASSARADASLFEMLSPRLPPDEHDEAEKAGARVR